MTIADIRLVLIGCGSPSSRFLETLAAELGGMAVATRDPYAARLPALDLEAYDVAGHGESGTS